MLGKAIGLRNEAYLENEQGALFEAGAFWMQMSGRVRAGCGGMPFMFPGTTVERVSCVRRRSTVCAYNGPVSGHGVPLRRMV